MDTMKATEVVPIEVQARIDELELQLANEKAKNAKLAGTVKTLRDGLLVNERSIARYKELAEAGEGALWLYELRNMIDEFVKSKEAAAFANKMLRMRDREEKLAAACATEDWRQRIVQGFADADIDTREKVANILKVGIQIEQ